VTALSPARTEAIDVVAQTLLPRASLLTRLLLRTGTRSLSRTEAGLLGTLLDGPRRITELAETEAVAQPTMTQLVDKLQARGLVARERSPQDGRVVLVTATDAGRAELAAVRDQYRALLRDVVGELSDAELETLVEASETLGRVIDAVQQRVEAR
jgi:DNA-binding MarR family transcriptional regulator